MAKNVQDNILAVYSPPTALQKYRGRNSGWPPDSDLDAGAYSSIFKKVPLRRDFVSSAFRTCQSKPSLGGAWGGRGVRIDMDRGLASRLYKAGRTSFA